MRFCGGYRVPNCRRIIKCGPYYSCVGCILDVWGTAIEISSYKAECTIALSSSSVDMFLPCKVIAESNTEVFAVYLQIQVWAGVDCMMSVYGVVGCCRCVERYTFRDETSSANHFPTFQALSDLVVVNQHPVGS